MPAPPNKEQDAMETLRSTFGGFTQLPASDFKIIETPAAFLEALLERIQKSKRLFFAALALGHQKYAKRIIDQLALRVKSKKQTLVFLDKSRNERCTELMTQLKMKGLIGTVRFIDKRTSSFLPGIGNEFLCVFHEKAYIFDNEVILSGANLDDPYLHNRVDRYFIFNNPALVNDVFYSVFITYCDYMPSDVLSEYESGTLFPKPSSHACDYDTFMFSFSGCDEYTVLRHILSLNYTKLYISTSYLNFTKEHLKLFANIPFILITTSPAANTFNNSNYLGTLITDIYAYSTYVTAQALPSCDLYEYYRNGLSFHSKGLWAFSDEWCITTIGSTNMNQRSIYVDSERTWLIATRNLKNIKNLKSEVASIMKYSNKFKYEERRQQNVRWLVLLVFYLFNKFI